MNKRPSDDNRALIEAAILKRSGKGLLLDSTTGSEIKNLHQPSSYCDDDDDDGDTFNIINNTNDEGFEYLDHTADVQLHSWGNDLSSCLGQIIKCMFNYMTNINMIQIDNDMSANVATNIIAQAHDWKSLLFSFMDEWLFVFHDTGFIVKEIDIVHIDRERFTIRSNARGEKFDISKHTQGTEIKAITYSNMKIDERHDGCDIWVIVDI